MKLDKKLMLLALENAIRHDGKANPGAILGKLISIDPKVKENINTAKKEIENVIVTVNNMGLDEQKIQFNNLGGELTEKKVEERKLPELKNVKGKVIMRLAPYPSGPLHIGNARPYIINDEYVKLYKGKLLLVIDDTIGSEEKQIIKEAYDLIPDGLKWLNIDFDEKIIYKSDRLDIYYKYAKDLIKKEYAYVCKCSSVILRENRANGLECKCRINSVKTNLAGWEEMFEAKEGTMTLRIKTSMQHQNPAFRDRVIFRISDRVHPRVKTKYRIWPLLDFSWAVDDYLLGITHILRGKELMIESEMEKYIWEIFRWPQKEIIHTGLFQIEGIKISKSKSQKEVESGKYMGWDDPRTWSIQSLRKRGLSPKAIRNFILNLGLTQNEIKVPVDLLYSENRKLLDKEVDRYFFISNPKKIIIKKAPKLNVEVPLHPDNNRGFRKFKTSDEFYIQDKLEKNKMYRFMHLFNFMNNEFHSKELNKKLNAKLIHWIPVDDNVVHAELIMDNGDKIEGIVESNIINVKQNEVIQFERFGFVRLDKKTKGIYIFYFAHN
ncbi:glutamate--tRNA ligase [Candidatus Woesearchaeota archaeon]|nr:glutamate--tRNA ligase [Candidatus Woesearchaeota archaeon]